ncbi:hypothetical protein TURU_037332 [Turdus rufiventris]|nr:hypothetical protein TURU_037332 [Turdus rufiventris]
MQEDNRMSSQPDIYSLVFIKTQFDSVSDSQYNKETADYFQETEVTFKLIAFLSSNFKVTVAVAFLQRKDNLICFDGNVISYSVNENLFDKTGDLRSDVRKQTDGPVITGGLQQCPVRAAEEMGLAQFGQELAFRGHDSSFTVSVRGSSRRQNGGLGAVCGGRVISWVDAKCKPLPQYSVTTVVCVQLWSLQHQKDMDLLKQIQRGP